MSERFFHGKSTSEIFEIACQNEIESHDRWRKGRMIASRAALILRRYGPELCDALNEGRLR